MSVEIRKQETTYGETGLGQEDRVEVTYELGFATPSGGWVRFASVPEAVVQAAEDNAKAAQEGEPAPVDLSKPADGGNASSGVSPDTETGNAGTGDPEAPTMVDVTPTPAPQQDAAAEAQQ